LGPRSAVQGPLALLNPTEMSRQVFLPSTRPLSRRCSFRVTVAPSPLSALRRTATPKLPSVAALSASVEIDSWSRQLVVSVIPA